MPTVYNQDATICTKRYSLYLSDITVIVWPAILTKKAAKSKNLAAFSIRNNFCISPVQSLRNVTTDDTDAQANRVALRSLEDRDRV